MIDPAVINTAAPVLRRLTRTEYDNTVRDLFGSKVPIAANTFPPENLGPDNLFYKDGKDRTVLWDDVAHYIDAAEKIAEEAVANNIPELTCAPQNEVCVNNIIVHFGKRIWRRPLTSEEQTDLLALYLAGVSRNESFNDNLTTVIQAMLTSANFIFLPEIDLGLSATRPLDAYELATRLSYFIWSSTPDSILMAAADNNSLLDDTVLRAQVRRMLKDPKAENLVSDFSAQWLKFARRYSKSSPDTTLFPNYSEALHTDMGEETRLFMRNLIFTNQPVYQLATASYSFVNHRLAGFYGLTDTEKVLGTVIPIPITVQAESYANAMDTTLNNLGNGPSNMGVDVQSTTDIDGGYNVGYIEVGEWLEYNVTIPLDAEYDIAIRTAALTATGEFMITAGTGPNIISTANISVPTTGGYQNWQTQTNIKLGKLYKGVNTIRINITGANFNINWFTLNQTSPGIDPNAFKKVAWRDTPRFGVISHASILTATSANAGTNPAKRGAWVLNSLLCDAPALPESMPPNIVDNPNYLTPVSTREIFEKIHQSPECADCHKLIDPIGFGLENYGPIGQWRTEEIRAYYLIGNSFQIKTIGTWPIESSGVLADARAFEGPQELSEIIGTSPMLPMCVAKHLATYAIGRNVVAYAPGRVKKEDFGLIKSIYDKTLANGNRFEDILEEIVMSPAFRNRSRAQ